MTDDPGELSGARIDVSFELYGILTATVRRFYDQLVDYGEKLAKDPDGDQLIFGASIVLCDTACEVAAGTAARWIAETKHETTTAVMDIAIREFDLGVDHIRDIWNAITGDNVQDQSGSSDFTGV